jgi:hypothetical protein
MLSSSIQRVPSPCFSCSLPAVSPLAKFHCWRGLSKPKLAHSLIVMNNTSWSVSEHNRKHYDPEKLGSGVIG